MGEKGSLKNRIKDFFKIQKKLRKKKQEEIELKLKKKQQLKKYSRPKIFITVVLGYLGNILMYPFTKKVVEKPKKNREKNSQFKPIEQKELLKQEKINIPKKESTILVSPKIEVVNQKEEQKEDKLESKKTENKAIQIDFRLIEIEQQLDKVNTLEEISKIDKNLKKVNESELNYQSKYKIRKLKEKISNKQLYLYSTLKVEKKDDYQFKKKSEKIIPTLIVTGGLSAHLLHKAANELVDSIRFESNDGEIENKISKEDNVQNNNDKITETNDKQTNVDINKEDDQIPNIKMEPQTVEIDTKNQYKEKEEKLDDFYISINEISIAHKEVEKEILIQEEEIKKIKLQLEKIEPETRKKSLLFILNSNVNRILNRAFSLSPLLFFKNKMVGGIVGSVFLNHRVKKMRKLINDKNMNIYYNVKELLKQINSKKDAIIKNININIDTLDEIANLKSDILNITNNNLEKHPEVFKIMLNLNQLEDKIKEKNRHLKKKLEEVKELEEKGKIKFKKIDML